MLLYIVGYMGSGKSTAAVALSRFYKVNLYDTDHMLENFLGMSVAEQLTKDYYSFRRHESNLAAQLAQLDKGIVALGGGVVETESTILLLKDKPVLFLDPGVDICWQRVQLDSQHRPLATDYDSFVALYTKRLPLYLSVCRWRLAENLSSKQLLGRLKLMIGHTKH